MSRCFVIVSLEDVHHEAMDNSPGRALRRRGETHARELRFPGILFEKG